MGLDNVTNTLENLNLSHNRVASLEYFQGKNFSELKLIDLADNYIGSVQHILYLKPITALREIILNKNDAANPICDIPGYVAQVL